MTSGIALMEKGKKMKKIFEKLKHKIIRKLGGYVVDPNEECAVHVSQRRLITMCSDTVIDHIFPRVGTDKSLYDYEKETLAMKLGKELMKNELIGFNAYAEGDDTIKLRAIITVAEPVNYEVNYFLGEET